jgi:hypothetical protein
MTYNSVSNGSTAYKPVRYEFNANNNANNIQVSLKPKEPSLPQPKTEQKIEPKAEMLSVPEASKVSSERITLHPSEMPEISFAPSSWSRNLILYENKKPAISKKYYFNYDGKTFAGVMTNDKGHIYLYDRSSDFYRPLKHLHRYGDPYSQYHAGFKEESNKKKSKSNYINLGALEILQAALQSSAGGKYAVKINPNDSFMVNWMYATSPITDEKFRYWNSSVTKLNTQRYKKLLPLVVPYTIGLPITLAIQKIIQNNKRKKTLLSEDNNNFNTPNDNYADTLIDKT